MGILDSINNGKSTLHTFNGAPVKSLGMVKLAVQADFYHLVTFHVMDVPTPHNAILGQNWLHKMRVVPSTYHLLPSTPLQMG